ncbi:major facilitator superfamily domain-containing protein [Dioszegia hungarica]|uniref:Major facilitator superfamily domain-containing protein n=1 Tax=Dioszegia hungarica TaxID=4972 RepID=A0AA38LX98_9TREE|nr:major facilitator superfamily domain-containing protein [Dioszegia hungarica]KAI9637141.1 major facilitator superfamily domain-containing protein [Dioszegia hungarica]
MSHVPAYPRDEIAGVELHPIEQDKDLDNKHPGGSSDDIQAVTNNEEYDPFEVDQNYLVASRTTKFFRGVLFQMVLFGALSFVGPSMNDAISNLGGGGLSTPYLANLANALNYTMSCLLTLFGGPIINKVGIKWACVIAAFGMPLGGSGYYTRARLGIDWYLLLARCVGGITGGFLYVGESTAMLSYPLQDDRGLYLGIWSAMRNSGSIMGGAINFATNFSSSTAGGIAWSTYLIFIGFECTGVIWAFLLSPTAKVRRKNGTRIPSSPPLSWKKEFIALYQHAKSPRTWLMFVPAFYSFFCGGTFGTYLSLNFSVRARALSSLIVPSFTVPLVVAYGKLILDRTSWSQKKRAWVCVAAWVIPQGAAFVWVSIQIAKQQTPLIAYDYGIHGARWAEAYMPYAIMLITSYWCQLSIYWILGTFSTDVKSASRTGGLFRAFETAGQAISYGINATAANKNVPMWVNIAVFVVTLPALYFLIRLVPEKPLEHDDVADSHLNEPKVKA